MSQTYRINRADDLNWTVEEHQPSKIISRGRYAGQQSKDKWVVIGYYKTLKGAAMSVLDKEIGNEYTGKDVMAAIENAEKRVMAVIEGK